MTPSRTAYMTGSREQTAVVVKHLAHLLSYLRAMYLSYQTSHWQTKGPVYYGNHLLFQRLYESVQAEIDTLAEKMVGYFGSAGVNLDGQVDLISTIAQAFSRIPDHHQRGLESEAGLQRHLKSAYDAIKESGLMTLGLDDFLMATASAHETNMYLLQQVLNTSEGRLGLTAASLSAESYFFDNPERREVREFAHTKAVSNVPVIAAGSGKADKKTPAEIRHSKSKAMLAPPTPTDIRQAPGAREFSTLNRFIVETEQPTDHNMPQGHADVRKHRRIEPSKADVTLSNGAVVDVSENRFASWTFAPRR